MSSAPQLVTFVAGAVGRWRVDSLTAVTGEAMPAAPRLAMVEGGPAPAATGGWALQGVVGHARYAERAELTALAARQEGLGRREATRAALIPIRKSAVWWALAQDERRDIMEARGRHTALGLEYLPMVARRLHHSRDLLQPFDFLTWFEFAPEHEALFDEMTARLRATPEWSYVDREVDVRLTREEGWAPV